VTEPQIKVTTFPMSDTGMGKAYGFEDDAEWIAHEQAVREAMEPSLRDTLAEFDLHVARAFIEGT
jgi:hypothetical protein